MPLYTVVDDDESDRMRIEAEKTFRSGLALEQ